jgi:predicted MFS family arabinose efflux permease
MFERAVAAADKRVGGPARRRVVLLFACVLGLESADLGTVGAVATELEHAFGIGHAQLGLLASISLLVGALVTIPFGVLADRTARVRLLVGSIVLWSAAMIATGLAPSYAWLIVARVGLGAVMAAAGPVVASLTGDMFPPRDRARIYGYILSGEFVGAAIGFLVSGNLAGLVSWRAAFLALSVPGFALALALRRLLPEPERRRSEPDDDLTRAGARGIVSEHGIEPRSEGVLSEDPTRMSLRAAVRYVLRIRTNVILIAASALGYFFFAGMRTFAVAFLRGQFGLGQSAATTLLVVIGLGSLAGVLLGGRIADRMLHAGRLDARIVVPSIAFVGAAIVLAPGIATTSLALAGGLFVVGGAGLSAANPPLDAARLDIVPSRLWGRAESVRTVLRQVAQAGAPLLFGVTADALGGLDHAFLIMLVPLGASGLVVWLARGTYARDVATAAASEETAGRLSPRKPGGDSHMPDRPGEGGTTRREAARARPASPRRSRSPSRTR